MKSSPSSLVGSTWSGRPERSRTLNRKSSGQRANTASIRASTRASTTLGMTPSRANYTSSVEHGNAFLLQAAVYFAAAVMAVMAAHRLGLGSVAGYLLAGIAIGPWGLKLVGQPEAIRAFAELGVVFLLFVVGTLVLGHFIARPIFRHIARTRLREIFTAFALLLVLGIALLFETAGLSMALGAFLAGVLLAESEYRHEIEAAIDPFKGLLLGLFFISVGMSVDFSVLLARPWVVVGLIVGLFILKSVVLWVIAHLARLPTSERPLFILLVAQGGEFAFVILGLGALNDAIPEPTAQAITLAVALSMLLTPFLLVVHDRFIAPRVVDPVEREPDQPEPGSVIVAGLGRVGQVVARLLNASR